MSEVDEGDLLDAPPPDGDGLVKTAEELEAIRAPFEILLPVAAVFSGFCLLALLVIGYFEGLSHQFFEPVFLGHLVLLGSALSMGVVQHISVCLR